MEENYAPKLTNASGRSVSIGDLSLYYEEFGSGEPLLLLHGFGGCSQNWHPFIPELSKTYKVIAVDLRGHGYSTNPGNKFTHKEAAKDLFVLMEKIGIKQCSALGMSTGGMILLHMATMQPDKIVSMVLISATLNFPEQARIVMRNASLSTMPAPVQHMYRECAKRGEEQIRQLISQFNAFHNNYDDMNFSAENLNDITARTLIIHGDRDKFFPVEIPIKIHRSIPKSSLWVIPNGEHVPVFGPKAAFTECVTQFLAGDLL